MFVAHIHLRDICQPSDFSQNYKPRQGRSGVAFMQFGELLSAASFSMHSLPSPPLLSNFFQHNQSTICPCLQQRPYLRMSGGIHSRRQDSRSSGMIPEAWARSMITSNPNQVSKSWSDVRGNVHIHLRDICQPSGFSQNYKPRQGRSGVTFMQFGDLLSAASFSVHSLPSPPLLFLLSNFQPWLRISGGMHLKASGLPVHRNDF
ncbi:hypothetical protein JB92DRAFT_108202 [Gautieria morchelliformis]|nr:hypothetical protein JB92DRAFT_108202 [Gautieria morchelliformis]